MIDDKEIEDLIRVIAQRVLARLGEGGEEAGSGSIKLLLLLPDSTAGIERLASRVGKWVASGVDLRAIVSPAVARDLDASGLRGKLGRELCTFDEVDLCAELAGIDQKNLVLVGSIGFESARALCELRDGSPFVRLVSQAILHNKQVAVIADDLKPRAGAGQGRAAVEAESLLRDLERNDLVLIDTEEVWNLISRLRAGASTLTRTVGDLLTEEDVERLAAEGERKLTLSSRTVVTPLAASRAAELGIELVGK